MCQNLEKHHNKPTIAHWREDLSPPPSGRTEPYYTASILVNVKPRFLHERDGLRPFPSRLLIEFGLATGRPMRVLTSLIHFFSGLQGNLFPTEREALKTVTLPSPVRSVTSKNDNFVCSERLVRRQVKCLILCGPSP
jgi:hypothetical protein